MLVYVQVSKEQVENLDYGIHFQNINVGEKGFAICCLLQNNMLSDNTVESTWGYVPLLRGDDR